jgi:PAS domain S-box-containing protein
MKTYRNPEEELSLLHQTFVHMAEGVCLIRVSDGVIVFANPKFEKLFGYEYVELVGKHVSTLNAPTNKQPEEIAADIINALRKKGVWSGDILNIKKDGTPFWCSATVSSFNSEQYGTVWLAIHQDITERRSAELQLQKSEQRFRSLFENMLDGFAYCKMIFENGKPHDFKYLEVNRAFEKLTGLKNVAGKKVSEIIPGIQESYPALFETYGRVSLTGQPEQFELYLEPLDACLYISVYSPEKEYFVAVFENITEKRRAEQKVRFQSSIIENLPDAVCAIDLNGLTVSWNKGAEKMLGYKADEMIGKPIANIIPEEIAQKELEHCLARLNTEAYFTGYKSVRLSKDGETIPVELTGVAIKDSNGMIKNYASVIVDISNRNKLEEERLKNHMLESVGILAGGIAHDFNNLLTIINSDIGIAKMFVESDDRAVDRLSNAERVCMIASELSRRLLMFSSGGDPVKKVMPVSDLVVTTTNNLLKGTNVSIEIDFPNDLYPVAIDEGQIKQVVSNLIANAIETMPNGGTLTVRGENLNISAQDLSPIREGHYLKISISDTGAGIPSENSAKIFDPYYSTKGTYSQKGLGLGLAVCYSVITKHDGLITVDSEVGKGTTFNIYLPAAR